MEKFAFEIVGRRSEDGTGTVEWNMGDTYGQSVYLNDYDVEYTEAAIELTKQALNALETLDEVAPH